MITFGNNFSPFVAIDTKEILTGHTNRSGWIVCTKTEPNLELELEALVRHWSFMPQADSTRVHNLLC